ncbi:MAG: sigma 54-interacting transcriptional regulator [Desulfomonilaceae bacterium]|nr:sigma 54-interacting transcriptional regulator [Desulfomonilaceae bacterium]
MASSGSIRILYMEDDAGLARLFQKKLSKSGYAVDTAPDGEQGLAAHKADPYDILAVDHRMPGKNGLDVIRELGEEGTLPPTIMITGAGDERVAVEAMKLGAADYIIKDVEGGYLRLMPMVIERAVAKQRLLEEKEAAERALRQSEEMLRLIMDVLPACIAYVEPDRRYGMNNRTYETWFGVPVEDLKGRHISEITGEAAYDRAREAIDKVLAGETCSHENRIPCVDGRTRDVNIVFTPHLGEGGEVKGFVVLTTDITELKKVQDQLSRAKHELERRVEQRTAELARANEELRREIVERTRAEERSHQQHEFLRVVLESVTHPLLVIDVNDYTVLMANSAAGKDVARGHTTCYSVLHGRTAPCRSPETPCPLVQVRQTGKPSHVEHVVTNGWSNPKYYEIQAYPIFGKAGDVAHIIEYCVDITDRKTAESALRDSEAKFRHIHDNAPVMMFSVDTEGRIRDVNKKWLEETRYSRDLVIGRTLDFVMTPESARRALTQVGPQLWEEGHVKDVPFEYVRKDGDVMDVLFNSIVTTDPAGEAVSLSVVTDVTERKRAERELRKSEERFRAIFETAQDCIFVKDRSHVYTHVNPATENLLGLSAAEIVGRTDKDLFGSATAQYLEDVERRVLAGQLIDQENTRLVRGVPLTFHDIRVPLRSGTGEIIGLCGISRDITERRKSVPAAFDEPVKAEYVSPAIKTTMAKARLAAKTDSIILLLGESGAGKDYFARYIHENSNRKDGPYFAINCAAVAPEIAEGELFGHEAGAFTGASGRKRGLLELAEGGTLLLNEIGELPLRLQAKLLTFLDTRSLTRVGGEKNIPVNARLMAATNRDLEKEVRSGKFRQDLFYRLNVLSITVPPLRERLDDLPMLAARMVEQLAVDMQLPRVPVIDSDTLQALSRYSWPGNVRELRNVLERALILSGEGRIAPSSLAVARADQGDWSYTVTFPADRHVNEVADEVKRALVGEALHRAGGNKQKAAKLLGVSRYAFFRMLKSLEMIA